MTAKKRARIATALRFAKREKKDSMAWNTLGVQRGKRMASKMKSTAIRTAMTIALWNCSIVLPAEEFISQNNFGYWIRMCRQVRYRITDFIGQAAGFAARLSESSGFNQYVNATVSHPGRRPMDAQWVL